MDEAIATRGMEQMVDFYESLKFTAYATNGNAEHQDKWPLLQDAVRSAYLAEQTATTNSDEAAKLLLDAGVFYERFIAALPPRVSIDARRAVAQRNKLSPSKASIDDYLESVRENPESETHQRLLVKIRRAVQLTELNGRI